MHHFITAVRQNRSVSECFLMLNRPQVAVPALECAMSLGCSGVHYGRFNWNMLALQTHVYCETHKHHGWNCVGARRANPKTP